MTVQDAAHFLYKELLAYFNATDMSVGTDLDKTIHIYVHTKGKVKAIKAIVETVKNDICEGFDIQVKYIGKLVL